MALAETFSETSVCNMALGRIGSKRGTTGEIAAGTIGTDTSVQAIHCRQHYEQTRNALLRSFRWRFATRRVKLTSAITSPEFEYDNFFQLPDDFLRLRSIYEISATRQYYKYSIEGNRLYSDDSTVNIRYIWKVIDVSLWDPLFTEVFVLKLARKLAMPLTQGPKLLVSIDEELKPLMNEVRALDRIEQNILGRHEMDCWLEARRGT